MVVNTNRIIAAFIREGTSRFILFSPRFRFLSPDLLPREVDTHWEEILRKARLTAAQCNLVLMLLYSCVTIIPAERYARFLREARRLISDPADAHFLALAMALRTSAIWTDDRHFRQQQAVPVWSTRDMQAIMHG